MEVMGFEPTASTLRKFGSQCSDQDLSRTFLVALSIPSGSLTIPLLPSRKDT